MHKYLFLILFLSTTSISSFAQTTHQNSGWFALMNSTKISDRFGAQFDFQLRSLDKWQGVKHVLVRPGITYFADKNNDITVGYLFTQTYATNAPSITENRAWEQFIHRHKIGRVGLTHRLRLEQRFIEKIAADDVFAQRLRYFIRTVLPLKKEQKIFEKGFFVALQNEVFLNIQNKGKLNGDLFDQNRAYLATGYRINKKVDVELGYMNQEINGILGNTNNNVLQLALYTRF